MLIWDDPERVNSWARERGAAFVGKDGFTALGWEKDGQLIGALIFYSCNGRNCSVNIALDGGSFPRGLLRSGLLYSFYQLELRRLTFVIEEANLRCQNLVRALGAVHEATLRDAGKTGNLLIYALFPDSCELWKKLNGQARSPASPRSEQNSPSPREREQELV